jgi:hypothetical protein
LDLPIVTNGPYWRRYLSPIRTVLNVERKLCEQERESGVETRLSLMDYKDFLASVRMCTADLISFLVSVGCIETFRDRIDSSIHSLWSH